MTPPDPQPQPSTNPHDNIEADVGLPRPPPQAILHSSFQTQDFSGERDTDREAQDNHSDADSAFAGS